jgi:3-hydroxyacyl-CoA dehydrogenase
MAPFIQSRFLIDWRIGYLGSSAGKDTISSLLSSRRLQILSDLRDAVQKSDIIQEQGPENISFKQKIWPEIERYASSDSLFWSSTSGIPASVQAVHMLDKRRLLVVHPYNPPHIMPLIEIVPSADTNPKVVVQTEEYWKGIGREPVVLGKETTGFVANRLAFVLLREAIHLVNEGVISVPDLDRLVESSMGPRWAVAGPFKSYHMGGGAGGLEGFMENIGRTVQACWDDAGIERVGDGWEQNIYRQTKDAYGEVKISQFKERDAITKEVFAATSKKRSGNSKI